LQDSPTDAAKDKKKLTEIIIKLKNEMYINFDTKITKAQWKEATDDLNAAIKDVEDMVLSLRQDVDARRNSVNEMLATTRHDAAAVESNLKSFIAKITSDTAHVIHPKHTQNPEDLMIGVWASDKGTCSNFSILRDHDTNRIAYEEVVDESRHLHGCLKRDGKHLMWEVNLGLKKTGEPPWCGPDCGEETEAVGYLQIQRLTETTLKLECRSRVPEEADYYPPERYTRISKVETEEVAANDDEGEVSSNDEETKNDNLLKLLCEAIYELKGDMSKGQQQQE